MRLGFLAVVVFLFSAAASFASCEEEVQNALQNFWTSGPFHFEHQTTRSGYSRKIVGELIPGKAQHRLLETENGVVQPERAQMGGAIWERDKFGWTTVAHSASELSLNIPKSMLINNAQCEGVVELGEQPVEKFSFETFPYSVLSGGQVDTIYVEPDSGLIVRHEITGKDGASIHTRTTFIYDASIMIEAPDVDPRQRWLKSLELYNEAMANSDPICRNAAIEIIKAGQSTLPFQFRVQGSPISGISGKQGQYVPPHSIEYLVEGVPAPRRRF